ncbi:cellulose synthase [[Pantoea] beijingensis]|uniref:Cellulose synthase n=1 Tax=[Pantoea] beijingensis TaxID=1324864 RepID=A0A443IE46_9GAMM|nr:cellulose biosynthesis protein BcsD [[Pantoea] beijingensis]RWR02280.1 cellulose synthase [[Pantoea] beijingensis]
MSESRSYPHPSGWFELLGVIVSGMLENAGEAESHGFLQNMGDRLARLYPLNSALTVGELEIQINMMLARFGWGFIDLQPHDNALVLQHRGLPAGESMLDANQWRHALGAVLCGLYARWLREQGGAETVSLVCDAISDDALLLFRYQNG